MKYLAIKSKATLILMLVCLHVWSISLVSIAHESLPVAKDKSAACKHKLFKKSKVSIEAILTDLDSTYSQVGGGGISEIKQTRTNVYVVSILQEEMIDQLTYEVSVDEACKVKILRKEPSTKSFQR